MTSIIAPLLVGIFLKEIYMERTALDYQIDIIETEKNENKIDFTIITFINSGNLSIPAKKKKKDIRVLVDNSKIIECKIGEESLKYLDLKITYDSSNVFIKPLLLNPKERFSLYLITKGEKPNIEIFTRIEGVSQQDRKLDLTFSDNYILRYLSIHLSVFSGILLLVIYSKFADGFKNIIKFKNVPYLIGIFAIILIRYCSVFIITQSYGFTLLKFVAIYIGVIFLSWILFPIFHHDGVLGIHESYKIKKRKRT